MKTIPEAQKRFEELAIGDTFYLIDISETRPFTKTSECQGELAISFAVPHGVKRTVDVDFPDTFTVKTPARHEIFDGRNRVMLDHCCDGSVKLAEVMEGRAWPNLIEAPKCVESVLACMKCGRVLHTIERRKQ
jgi:hypothetical protein